MQQKARVYRAYGLQRPLNAWQVLVVAFHVANAVVFYLAASLKFDLVHFLIYTTFCTVAIAAWFYTSLVDAALPPSGVEKLCCVPFYCFKKAQLKKRYCAVTRKSVPGMDHYCRWMNTAIGSRNYVGFFTVISSSTILFIHQGVFSIVSFVTINFSEPGSLSSTNTVLLNVCSVILFLGALGGISSHGVLLLFHCYLIKKQFGTYDFLIERSKAKEKTGSRKEESNNKKESESNGGEVVHKNNKVQDSQNDKSTRIHQAETETEEKKRWWKMLETACSFTYLH